ncbi:hypothetical protein NDU88_001649 [Pleurodeles waltl]|uniref:Uncharacterized protein n=1 Tax=Pleurodeles waltl TaxID=8319 RepID=A0AAV7LBY0_PLEWA|nr:hypothetical protein NDU88_001649 [Pleurodeles waltl]
MVEDHHSAPAGSLGAGVFLPSGCPAEAAVIACASLGTSVTVNKSRARPAPLLLTRSVFPRESQPALGTARAQSGSCSVWSRAHRSLHLTSCLRSDSAPEVLRPEFHEKG